MRKSDPAMYRIKTVSELTGIPKNTLVAWERRYGILNPERQDNGYRLYSDSDVAVLLQIKSALADGLRISEAIELVNQTQAQGSTELPQEATHAFDELAAELERALLAYDREGADLATRRLVGVSHVAAIDHIYVPMLRSIGDGWERGEVSVAQEHYASAYVRQQLMAMLISVGAGPKHGMHVACTTYPGDPHELGALGLAVRMALDGCRVTYLGPDTPLDALARFAKTVQPAWLCVSLILPADMREVLDYARELRDAAHASTSIVLGGVGLPELDNSPVNGVQFLRDWDDLALHAV